MIIKEKKREKIEKKDRKLAPKQSGQLL